MAQAARAQSLLRSREGACCAAVAAEKAASKCA